eukprot:5475289-Pyramimonas_sp.AAC.1
MGGAARLRRHATVYQHRRLQQQQGNDYGRHHGDMRWRQRGAATTGPTISKTYMGMAQAAAARRRLAIERWTARTSPRTTADQQQGR